MEEAANKRNALASLTDDAIVEILHCLPTHSLFCYKCVYHSWNYLISDYNNHKVLPQTLAKFFYDIDQGHRCYTRVTNEHPSLSFLLFTLANVAISNIFNDLILCWCRAVDGSYYYVVCNSIAKEFKELSPSIHYVDEARLGFDPIASSHFHVIEYIEKEQFDECRGVDIYSSKTIAWIRKKSKWGRSASMTIERSDRRTSETMYLNGCLHIMGYWWGYQ
ncbi:uncharacterized protein [Miscanthus floridulus]|uniref:uncharacterized protein n=1 Tax=Miscanthus floridulus TaxID=154761 RepID=UPI003457B891